MMLIMKFEVEEFKCNFEVLYDMLYLGESYVLLLLVEDNLVVLDVGFQCVEFYVNLQQGVIYELS